MMALYLLGALLGSQSFAFGDLGHVTVFGDAQANQVVLLVADNDALPGALQALSPSTLLIHVQSTGLLDALAQSNKTGCLYPAARLEDLSHYAQKILQLPSYYKPTLLGAGPSAALVFAVLAQSPPNTFAAALSANFCPTLAAPRALCRGRGLHISANGALSGAPVDEPWAVSPGCPAAHAVINATATAEILADAAPNTLQTTLKRFKPLGAPAAAVGAEAVRDLPLVEVPVSLPGSLMAVMISGDGGWASIDRELAHAFADANIPTIGLSSLQYFWKARSPDESAADLTRMVRYYSALWQRPNVLLVGFSLGADVLPFMASRQPADVQARIRRVAFLGPSPEVSFEFHLTDWLGGGAAHDALPVAAEIAKLPCGQVTCIFAAKDGESACTSLRCGEISRVPGGHHFGGDYAALAKLVLATLPAELVTPP